MNRPDSDPLRPYVGAHHKQALQVARAMTGDMDAADDLLAETWARAWSAWRSYSPERPFLPWFTRIMRNLWISQLRRRRPPSTSLSTLLLDPAAPGDVESETASDLAFEQILSLLPADMQAPVRLAMVEGCTLPEIARRLELPLSTVRARYYRALARLRNSLYEATP